MIGLIVAFYVLIKILIILLVYTGHLGIDVIMWLHNPLFTIPFYLGFIIFRRGFSNLFMYTAFIVELFIPLYGFGIICFVFVIVMSTRKRFVEREFGLIEEMEVEDDHEVEDYEFNNLLDASKLSARKERGSAYLASFSDIIRYGSDKEKKETINKLTRIVTPNSIKLLKVAKTDRNYETQLYATKALNKIEEEINAEIVEVRKTIKSDYNNPVHYSDLGDLYFRYFNLKLYEDSSNKVFLERALEEYEHYERLKPESLSIQEKILRIYQHKNKHEVVIEKTDNLISSGVKITDKLHELRASSFYSLRNYSKIKKEVSNIKKSKKEILKDIGWWEEVDG